MQRFVKAEEIAEGHWGFLLAAAGVDERSLRKSGKGPCPFCGGNTRCHAFDVGAGRLYCHACNKVFNPFEIVMHLQGMGFREAADWVRDQMHAGDPSGWAPLSGVRGEQARPERTDDEVRRSLRRLLAASRPIRHDSPVQRYLAARVPGLLATPSVLSEHPRLDYWEYDAVARKSVKHGSFAAMLARVQGVEGEVVNVWRTYVDAHGAKAPVGCAKKAAGRFLGKGYAVRLAEPGKELGVSEGIETALSAQMLRGIPTWSTLSAVGMRGFELPPQFRHVVKTVVIFADNDAPDELGRRAGNEAAHALKERLRAQGFRSYVVMPAGTRYDFNDILKNKAQSGALRQTAAALEPQYQ